MPTNSNKYDREWRKKNPERAKIISDRYRNSKNGKKTREAYRRDILPFILERYKEIKNRWRQNNQERMNFYSRIRRYLKKNAEGFHTFREWELLKKRYDYMCFYCKRKEPEIKLTEDHIVPLSKGGSNNIENIQPLCGRCNSRKHTKIINFIIN